MRYHLILKEIQVKDASAYNNYYVMGMPALTSFSGFVDALKIAIENKTDQKIVKSSFSIITHDYTFNNTKEKHVKYMNVEGSKFDKPPSNKDEFKCDFNATIIVNFDFEENDDMDFDLDESDFSLFSYDNDIQDMLHSMRVAGGDIENTNDFLSIVNSQEGLYKQIKSLNRGFFISDASSSLEEYTSLFEGDVLKAIIHMSALFEREDSFKEKSEGRGWERAGDGWLTPTNIGYTQINEKPIEDNEGSRSEHSLYYVEPLTSMIEYLYTGRIMRKISDDDIFSSLIDNKVVFSNHFSDNTYKVIKQENENE